MRGGLEFSPMLPRCHPGRATLAGLLWVLGLLVHSPLVASAQQVREQVRPPTGQAGQTQLAQPAQRSAYGIFVTLSSDGEIGVWYETIAELVRLRPELEGQIRDVALSPDGVLVVGTSTGTVAFYRLPSGEEIAVVPGAHPGEVSKVAAVEGYAASADSSGRVNFWQVGEDNVTLINTRQLHQGVINVFYAEPVAVEGKGLPYLVSAGSDRRILFTTFDTQEIELSLDATGVPRQVFRYSHGVWAWLGANLVNQWDQRKQLIVQGADFANDISRVDFDDTSFKLLAIQVDGRIVEVDLVSQARRTLLEVPGLVLPTEIVYRDGFFYYGDAQGELVKVDLSDGSAEAFELHQAPVRLVKFFYWFAG